MYWEFVCKNIIVSYDTRNFNNSVKKEPVIQGKFWKKILIDFKIKLSLNGIYFSKKEKYTLLKEYYTIITFRK